MSIEKDLTVAKDNTLTEASYRISLQEQRLIVSCLHQLDTRKKIPKEMRVTASQYADNFGLSMKMAHQELYKAADRLYERSITVKDDPSQTTKFRWVQKQVVRHKGEGQVTITFSDEILKYISQLKKGEFTSYKLHHVANLKSVYSMRLYEMLIQFRTTGMLTIRLDDFRARLALEDKYPQFKALKQWVINPAIKELNDRKKSNLIIKPVETIKRGRKITNLIFNFKINDQIEMDV